MNEDKFVHVFCFNEEENGGEAVMLLTTLEESKKELNFAQQEISLNCYGKTATITIPPFLTPEKLRQLADELEVHKKKYAT